MQSLPVGPFSSSRIVLGMMRLADAVKSHGAGRAADVIAAAVDAGITHFDHADIYGGGTCEELFGHALAAFPGLRDRILITTKCGIRFQDSPTPGDPSRFDFSASHIVNSVEGSLKRLRTDRIDILLLHRPDALGDPAEVAGAFDRLHQQGKVLGFGVSNFSTHQVDLYRAFLKQPILLNQVELNIHNREALTNGVLDQCLRLQITPQSWCPLGGIAYPAWGNKFPPATAQAVEGEARTQAEKYGCDPAEIALAWVLKHPAKILPVIGSMTPERIRHSVRALELPYTREDWYRLTKAAEAQP